MADNFLEFHREAYEKRKAQWLKKQKRRSVLATMQKAKELNEDETLRYENEDENETLRYENEN